MDRLEQFFDAAPSLEQNPVLERLLERRLDLGAEPLQFPDTHLPRLELVAAQLGDPAGDELAVSPFHRLEPVPQ